MIKKSIQSKSTEVLNKESMKQLWSFPVGTSFMLNGKKWTVIGSTFEDNTEMRRISAQDEDTILTLDTLRKDAIHVTTGFKFVDPLSIRTRKKGD